MNDTKILQRMKSQVDRAIGLYDKKGNYAKRASQAVKLLKSTLQQRADRYGEEVDLSAIRFPRSKTQFAELIEDELFPLYGEIYGEIYSNKKQDKRVKNKQRNKRQKVLKSLKGDDWLENANNLLSKKHPFTEEQADVVIKKINDGGKFVVNSTNGDAEKSIKTFRLGESADWFKDAIVSKVRSKGATRTKRGKSARRSKHRPEDYADRPLPKGYTLGDMTLEEFWKKFEDEHGVSAYDYYEGGADDIQDYGTTNVSQGGKKSEAVGEVYGDVMGSVQIAPLSSVVEGVDLSGGRARSLGFFPYLNGTTINLSDYQIYETNNDNEDVSCLLHTLQLSGVGEDDLEILANMLGDGLYISEKNLKKVCEYLQKSITLTREMTKGCVDRSKKRVICKELGKHGNIDMGQIEKHLFLNNTTKYTKFYVNNCKEIDDYTMSEDRFSFNERYKEGFRSKKPVYMNSFNLILNMKDAGYFKTYRGCVKPSQQYKEKAHLLNIEGDQRYDRMKEEDTLEEFEEKQFGKYFSYTDEERLEHHDFLRSRQRTKKGKHDIDERCSIVETSENTILSKDLIIVADTESDVSSFEDGTHTTISIGAQVLGSNKPVEVFIRGDYDELDAGRKLYNRFYDWVLKQVDIEYERLYNNYCEDFEKFKVKPVVYFHNLKYDLSCHDEDLLINQEISKDGILYSREYNHFGTPIECRDSYKLLSMSLKKIPAMLGLDDRYRKGEAINYQYHKIDNMKDHWISPDEYTSGFNTEEEMTIFNNIDKENSIHFRKDGNGYLFNPFTYYNEYLVMDVEVLNKSLVKFDKLIEEISLNITGRKLSAFDKLTISSLGNAIATNYGCYKGVVKTRGGLREFIQKAVRGGKVFCNPQYVKKTIDQKIQDFDGVSLYPSAMKRLCQDHGIAMGSIKKGGGSYDDYLDKSFYILKIKLIKLHKKVQVPLLGIKDSKTGILNYSNDFKNKVIYVDKYALEDLIKYQEIEFNVIEGVYWDKGYNKQIGLLAEKLHLERAKHKKTNEALSSVIKLLMNSIYGKTIMKRSEDEVKYVENDNAKRYLYNNFGIIKEIINIERPSVRVIQQVYDDSYSFNHAGVSILSMSKRIMNEVFYIMDINNMPMFYTDTDSIHMLDKDVQKLNEGFIQTFDRELIGKNLGQFHSDFDLKCGNGACKDVVSIKNITLGKKSYLDILEGTDPISGMKVRGSHVRLKGVTQAGIDKAISEFDNDPVELFEFLKYNEYVFTMNPKGSFSAIYDNNGVKTRKTGQFKRLVKF